MGCANDSEKKSSSKRTRNKNSNNDVVRFQNRRLINGDEEVPYEGKNEKNKEKSDDEEEDEEEDEGNEGNDGNDGNDFSSDEENNINRGNNDDIIRSFEPYLQAKEDPNFNFPEVKENKYVGKGLKKMKGYISNVTKEEIEKRREAFWGTRIEGNEQTWNFLKEICEMPPGDENELEAMLQAYDLKPYKNCINITYDASGGLYEIPNYCIHDPYEYDFPESHIAKPEEKRIIFKGRSGVKEVKLKASNYYTIKKLKSQIAKKLKSSDKKIRLFFSGKELKNEQQLWAYNIDNDCIIMIMLSP